MINYNIIHRTLINLISTWIPSQSLLSLVWRNLSLTRLRDIELNDSVSRDTQSFAFKCLMDGGSSCKDRSLSQPRKPKTLNCVECLMLVGNVSTLVPLSSKTCNDGKWPTLSWSLVKLLQPLRYTCSRFWALDKSGNSFNSFERERLSVFKCGSSCKN